MNTTPAITLSRNQGLALGAAVLAVLLWSGIGPEDRLTWAMEVIWVVIGLPLLMLTWGRFPLTRLLYILIALHCVLLMVGGHYTYAKVPLGLWVQDWLDLARNHYDRLGHFTQGFVPAILARELLLRLTPLKRGGWLFYLVVAAALSFSAFFELIEWWAALIWGGDADAFLATQGDPWDVYPIHACLWTCLAALVVTEFYQVSRMSIRLAVSDGHLARFCPSAASH